MSAMTGNEVLISVDVEASAGSPSVGSLLSIGACLVDDPSVGLYLELKPLADHGWSAEAERIHRLDRGRLLRDGLEPETAMTQLADWVAQVAGGRQPVFVGFNSPFDWMFVADYFWRFLGRNPFGISALDLKSYYMGREAIAHWSATRQDHARRRYGIELEHTHHALQDARDQARLAQVLLARRATNADESGQ